MIAWSWKFPRHKYLLGYYRLLRANHLFHDRIGWTRKGKGWGIGRIDGHKTRLEALRNSGKGRRCFVLGNGPSLIDMDTAFLKDELTIGTNGLYKSFPELGFTTDYLLFEDIFQTEQHGPDLHRIVGPQKIAALHTAHAIGKVDASDLLFMNARLVNEAYLEQGPFFSRDFSEIAYLSGTITYVALQFAYHLGCEEVYLLGVDFDYGPLEEHFPPGKLVIDEGNIDLVRKAHLNNRYYQIGDVIGVPDRQLQARGYHLAREAFESSGRKIRNASPAGKLEIFDRVRLEDVLTKSSRSPVPEPGT